MARPKNKKELIGASETNFSKLFLILDKLSQEEQETPFSFDEEFLDKQQASHWTRDNDIKDVLIHLHEWHQLLIDWLSKNLRCENVPFLPAPYNWKTYPKMNESFKEKHKDTSYNEARTLLENSHIAVMDIISSLSDEALFTKAYYPWAKTSTVGSYCISSTSSHYEWAIKKIKRHLKSFV